MAKLDTNSNVYTIIYATVIVVIVALLLAVVSSALKPKQQANIQLDTRKQILSSLNLDLKGQNVDAMYEQMIRIDTLGFTTDKAGNEVPQIVYVATLKDGATKYIVPMHGAGLWGAIWGYIALNEDKSTIFGTYFNHASETPGLGGEITTKEFQHRFIDKHVVAEGALKMIEIVKGDATDEQVAAISGATITSKGVEAMINTTLDSYKDFFVNAQTENKVEDEVAQSSEVAEEVEEVESSENK